MKKFKYKIEQRNKFLDKLGLKPHEYGVNFTYTNEKKKRKKQWEKERELYGFDSRETWCLNSIFAQWLYSHCKMYLKEASKIVDLSYYKFEYNGKTYTQEEAIKKIIKWTGYYIKHEDDWTEDDTSKYNKAQIVMKKAIELWAIIFPCMWW